MKKEINSKSRRKWIMGGLAAFASVALLTTGFAVWVVGVQETNKDADINVKVDTASNESLYFNIALSDDNILLAEDKVVDGADVFVKAKDGEGENAIKVSSNPLQITFSEIKVQYGKNSSLKPTKIAFSLDAASEAMVTTTNNQLGSLRTGESWKYINKPSDIVLPTSTDSTNYKTDASGNVIVTMAGVTADFTWGDYFGGKNASPCDFYNSKFNKTANNMTYDNSLLVQNELDAMAKAFESGTIKLVATLQ